MLCGVDRVAGYAYSLIEINLQLRHSLLCLLHAHDVNTKVSQVFTQLGVQHHVILGVAVHIYSKSIAASQ